MTMTDPGINKTAPIVAKSTYKKAPATGFALFHSLACSSQWSSGKIQTPATTIVKRMPASTSRVRCERGWLGCEVTGGDVRVVCKRAMLRLFARRVNAKGQLATYYSQRRVKVDFATICTSRRRLDTLNPSPTKMRSNADGI